VTVWAERMAGTEAVASQSLADDDPQVGIVHWAKSLAQRHAPDGAPRQRHTVAGYAPRAKVTPFAGDA
jgi:hypothetical protein